MEENGKFRSFAYSIPSEEITSQVFFFTARHPPVAKFPILIFPCSFRIIPLSFSIPDSPPLAKHKNPRYDTILLKQTRYEGKEDLWKTLRVSYAVGGGGKSSHSPIEVDVCHASLPIITLIIRVERLGCLGLG